MRTRCTSKVKADNNPPPLPPSNPQPNKMDTAIPSPPTHPPRAPDVLDRVYALHAFLAENADELSFQQGEWVDVVERDDEFGDGWWRGRVVSGGREADAVNDAVNGANGASNGNNDKSNDGNGEKGATGLFPASYVGRGGDVNEWLEMQRGESASERERTQ